MADIEEENAILKKPYASLQSREIRYQFIKDHSSKFHEGKIWEILDVKRSSYYAWLKTPQSERSIKDSLLSIEIKRVHRESDNTYGVRSGLLPVKPTFSNEY